MTVEIHKTGGVTLTGDSIQTYRLAVMIQSMKLELKTGLKLSRRRSAFSIARQEFGLKTRNKQVIIDEVQKIYDQRKLMDN